MGKQRTKADMPNEIRGEVVTRVWKYALSIYDHPSSIDFHMARWFLARSISRAIEEDRKVPPVELIYDNEVVVGVRVR